MSSERMVKESMQDYLPKPLCIDLFCGLGGWSEGFLAEGYECRGYDIEAHDYGTGGYPGSLALQDILKLHGRDCKDATVIVGSSPCQKYSYMAMPWKRAKDMGRWYADKAHPERREELNALFNAQFRIQREASEAAGRYIPLIVENVRGAQKWVGRAQWNYGSFYLWGDVPALMPLTLKAQKVVGYSDPRRNGGKGVHLTSQHENDLGRKVSMNFHEHEKTGKPGRSFQSAAVAEMIDANGTKQGGDWFGKNCESSMSRLYGSKSPKRKAASAMIAKIPLPLAIHIARTFKP